MRKVFITAAIIFCSTIGVKAQSSYGSTTNYGTNTSAFGVSSTNSSVRYQSGYTRKDGTYVQGHYKTTNNGTNHDNYSTRGNVNSFTVSQVQQALGLATIPLTPITMELVEPSILAVAVVNTM